MTLNAPSFFAGVGTVVVLLAGGFGGGVLMSGIISGDTPRAPNKVERRVADETKPEAKPGTVEPVPADRAVGMEASAQSSAPRVVVPSAAPSPALPAEPQPPANQQPATPQPQATQPAGAPQPNPQTPTPQPQSTQQAGTPQSGAVPPPPAAPGQAKSLGAEQPVALVNPATEETLSRREARAKAREARREEDRRRRVERREREEARRREQVRRSEESRIAGQRARQEEVDEDERREERPVFLRRGRDDFFAAPRFRWFGDD